MALELVPAPFLKLKSKYLLVVIILGRLSEP